MRIWTDLKSEIAALNPQSAKFAGRKELRNISDILGDDEHILSITQGVYDGRTWLLAGTNYRVLFLDQVMFIGLKKMEIVLSVLTKFSAEKGILSNNIVLHRRDGAACRITKVSKSAASEFCVVMNHQCGFEQNNENPESFSAAPAMSKPVASDFQINRGTENINTPPTVPPLIPPTAVQPHSFEYQCPHCRALLAVNDNWINLELECPECHAAIKPRPTLRVIASAPAPAGQLSPDEADSQSTENNVIQNTGFKYSNSIFPWWVWLFLSLLLVFVIVGVSNKNIFSCHAQTEQSR